MRCPQCGSPDMVTSCTDYRYTESGLSNVILKGITVHRCLKCGERLPVISRIKEWHERIATALLAKPSVLTGEEFRFLRKEMRLKASELASLMGVHKVTVSRWETNAEPISASADRLLRYIYATKKVESLAKHLSALNWAMYSKTIQATTRWLETRMKLIKRMTARHEPITIDLDDPQTYAYTPNSTDKQFDCSIIDGPLGTTRAMPITSEPCQPSWRFPIIPTQGTETTIIQPMEVVRNG